MTGVRIREGETFESALRRFKKMCEKAGIYLMLANANTTKNRVFERSENRSKLVSEL